MLLDRSWRRREIKLLMMRSLLVNCKMRSIMTTLTRMKKSKMKGRDKRTKEEIEEGEEMDLSLESQIIQRMITQGT